MKIRVASKNDLLELTALARLSVADLGRAFYDRDQVESAVECITLPDLDLIEDGTLYVAELDGEIVGCGGWSRRNKLYTGSLQTQAAKLHLNPDNDPARIRAFFVHPNMARHGIGTLLYQACIQSARSHGFKSIELMATLPGVPFYERLGFVRLEPVDILLTDGNALPCIRMQIDL